LFAAYSAAQKHGIRVVSELLLYSHNSIRFAVGHYDDLHTESVIAIDSIAIESFRPALLLKQFFYSNKASQTVAFSPGFTACTTTLMLLV